MIVPTSPSKDTFRRIASGASAMRRQLFILFLVAFLALASLRTVTIQNEIIADDGDDDGDFTTRTKSVKVEAKAKAPKYKSESKMFFDVISRSAYDKAIVKDKSSRKKFSLNGWERGSGGLDDADRKTLGKLYYEAESVFEFGLGESTLIASAVSVPRYAGVDSDALWVAKAREESKKDHFRFYFADIGKTVKWGYPVNEKFSKLTYNYQIAPLASELEAFDVYLVDGRYRVACACVSFLHAMKHNGDMTKILVGVHDNDDSSRHYEVLKDIADLQIENKKLWVYKLKPTTTQAELYKMWLDHQVNTAR